MSAPRHRGSASRRIVAALAIFATLVCTANATADVLIADPPHQMLTGGCIRLGVWYQAYSGGPRFIYTTVSYRGRIVTGEEIRATNRWRYHVLLCPNYRSPGVYAVRIYGDGWHYKVRVRAVIGGD